MSRDPDDHSLDNGLMTVLVCYDGSDEAQAALRCVGALAAVEPVNVTALFVRPKSPSGYVEMLDMARERIVDWDLDLPGLMVLREAEAMLVAQGEVEEVEAGQPLKLRHGLKQLDKELLEVHLFGRHDEHVRLRLRDGGDPAGVILNELDALPYDLVVMGSRGKKGIKKWLTGSTAQRVALFSQQTVLVVRGESPLDKVLLCTDGSAAAEQAVQFVAPLAAAKGCAVTVLGVAADEEDEEAAGAVQRAVARLAEAGVEAASRMARGDRGDAILAASEAYDLVVLGVSGKSHMRRFLVGSVPLKVLERSPASVMIVK